MAGAALLPISASPRLVNAGTGVSVIASQGTNRVTTFQGIFKRHYEKHISLIMSERRDGICPAGGHSMPIEILKEET